MRGSFKSKEVWCPSRFNKENISREKRYFFDESWKSTFPKNFSGTDKAPWLAVACHVTIFNQSKFFILASSNNYPVLKFDIGPIVYFSQKLRRKCFRRKVPFAWSWWWRRRWWSNRRVGHFCVSSFSYLSVNVSAAKPRDDYSTTCSLITKNLKDRSLTRRNRLIWN